VAVTSGGVLSATGTSFTRTGAGVTSTISVAAGGHLTASNCTFAFSNLSLANGSVLNSGDITGCAFDTTLFVPAIDVPLLTNNLRFQDVDINGGGPVPGPAGAPGLGGDPPPV